MTTLVGDELFEYLEHLEREVDKRISTSDKESLQYFAHSQMKEIIDSERNFLKHVYSNGTKPILSISPNGLPSVESLKPDLEKMCEMSSEEPSLGEVSRRFRRGVNGERNLYIPVCQEDWNKELDGRKNDRLQSRIGFEVNNSHDEKFELSLREDIYVNGYDQHSKEFPVLIREGKMKYHVVWNRLIEHFEENFYVPNNSLILSGREIVKPSEKKFSNINWWYNFSKKDFIDETKRHWLMKWKSSYANVEKIGYANFLDLGTSSRVRVTEEILELLDKAFRSKILIEGLNRNNLETELKFSNIPFSNAPRTILKDEDVIKFTCKENSNTYLRIDKSKQRLEFNLLRNRDSIAKLIFIPPCYTKHWGPDGDGDFGRSVFTHFDHGLIWMDVFGKYILNENQNNLILNGLKEIGAKII